MAYQLAHHGSVVLVRWGDPEAADLDNLVASMRALGRGDHGLIYVGFVPEGAGAPTGDVVRAYTARFHHLSQLCSTMHKVFEGSGFFVGFKRSVLTGILLAARTTAHASQKRFDFRVHSSLADVLPSLSPEHRRDISRTAALLGDARMRGVQHEDDAA